MSHATGTIQTIVPITIGPDSGDPPDGPNTWTHNFAHTPAPSGTKFVILHFQNADIPAGHRLEVDLGYDMDVFTAADGDDFWTRPVNLYVLAGALVPIRYITNGVATGSVQLDRYGRGERHAGIQDPGALSNSDPFLDPMQAAYLEPIYDPFWYCAEPPNWENAACAPGDVRNLVARSVGMIVSIHDDHVSTCSVTLVDSDKVITAGHCITVEDAATASITFDYQTDCAGNRPPGYNARFYKVTNVLEQRFQAPFDYALLQLATAPVGVPPVQLRHDVPAPGEQVFGIHHPNGAVKKLSVPSPGFSTVLSSSINHVAVPSDFHVSGGSSGSGLFDTAGRIIGVLSQGNPCGNGGPPISLRYYPIAGFLNDTLPAPPPPETRDVMVVVDRSGSMSQDEGTGRTKMEVARDAVSLFIQLINSGTGNRAGLVSFSSSASNPVEFDIAPVTEGAKTTLIGNAPYSGGVVGGLSPGGNTSIGGGLEAARLQFPAPGDNPRSILLLTDGMQNTDPMIEAIEGALGDIEVNVVGLGTEANLQGDLLNTLAGNHSGNYVRAGNGLALEKFFSEAFGNIFEAGILFDPERYLPANQASEPDVFPVSGEEMITAVAGWDRYDAALRLEITSPGGQVITSSSDGVERASGKAWTFIKVPLPYGGERDGDWKVRVVRPKGSTEFPAPTPGMNYFINVIPTGGPKLLRAGDKKSLYYTGDYINPRVMVRYDDGSWPHHADVDLTLTKPDKSIGNILTDSGLKPGTVQDGDAVPALQATLQAIEADKGSPVVSYVESTHTLSDDRTDTGGLFESGGVYGVSMPETLTVEGNYSFHARANYGSASKGARELNWSVLVAVGIDPDHTDVSTNPIGTNEDGWECMRLTITPRDRYNNHLGPGRLKSFELTPQPGTSVEGEVTDLGNGSYQTVICWDPSSGKDPSVGVLQPGRDVVIIRPTDVRRYVYSIKFLCGEQSGDCCSCGPVRPGKYATEINIHNFNSREVGVVKSFIPLVLAGAARGREPGVSKATARDKIVLPGHSATMDDCCRMMELLLGARPAGPVALTTGILEIVSTAPLSISAVYTVTDSQNGSVSIDVENIEEKRI